MRDSGKVVVGNGAGKEVGEVAGEEEGGGSERF